MQTKNSMKIRVKKVCAWCGKGLGTEIWDKKSKYHFDGCISHGICPACMKTEIAAARVQLAIAEAISNPSIYKELQITCQ